MLQAGEREGTKARHVITLVHGTWARKAGWIRPDSLLSKGLRERLGPDTRIFRLVWTGRNSPTARAHAAERLRKKLALRLKDRPTARHTIIGHSHGGNVALHAVAGSDLENRIDGIVCLATPFLVAREREIGENHIEYVWAAVALIAFLIVISNFAALRAFLPLPKIVFLALAALLTVVLALPLIALGMKWHAYAGRLCKELASPPIDPRRVLIVRSSADEASGALVFAQFMSWLTVRIYLRSQGLYARLERTTMRWGANTRLLLAVAAIALVIFFGVLATDDDPTLARWRDIRSLAGIVSILAAILAAISFFFPSTAAGIVTLAPLLLISILIWPMIVLLSVFLLPFGWRIALANILLDVTAETTPLGSSWTVHVLPPPAKSELKDATPLMHSTVYDDPAALDIICDWIATRGDAQLSGDADAAQAPPRAASQAGSN